MSNILEERQKNRWLLLYKIYEVTKEIPENSNVNIYSVGEQLGWNRKEIEAAFEYLQGEGLLKGITVGGGIKLTSQGIKEVEDYPDKPTLHFPIPNLMSIKCIADEQNMFDRPVIYLSDIRPSTWLIASSVIILFLIYFQEVDLRSVFDSVINLINF
jgi:hypothetical protein